MDFGGACVLGPLLTPRPTLLDSLYNWRKHEVNRYTAREHPARFSLSLNCSRFDSSVIDPRSLHPRDDMASRAASTLSSLLLSIAAATAAFSATILLPTVQAETNALRRDSSYGPTNPDFFVGYLDDRDAKDDAAATTGNRRVRPSAWIRYARRGIEFPFFVEDASSEDSPAALSSSSSSNRNLGKLWPADRALLERFVKRNIDEIDRTAFDNFFKRNIDEIDRVGWDGFVKRFANYLTTAVTWPNRPESRG